MQQKTTKLANNIIFKKQKLKLKYYEIKREKKKQKPNAVKAPL